MNFEGLGFHLRATTSKAISDSILEICQSIHYAQDHMIVEDWDEELTDIVTKQTRKGQRALRTMAKEMASSAKAILCENKEYKIPKCLHDKDHRSHIDSFLQNMADPMHRDIWR